MNFILHKLQHGWTIFLPYRENSSPKIAGSIPTAVNQNLHTFSPEHIATQWFDQTLRVCNKWVLI